MSECRELAKRAASHRTRREFLVGVGSIGGVIAIGACAPGAPGTGVSAPSTASVGSAAPTPSPTFAPNLTPVTVAVNSPEDMTQIPMLVAEAAGYFKSESVTVSRLSTGVMASALASAQVNYVQQSASSVFPPLREKGTDVVAFCQLQLGNANIVLLSTNFIKASGAPVKGPLLERIKALKGARWGATTPTGGIAVTSNYLMSLAGYREGRDYSMNYLGSTANMVAALGQNLIDCFAAYAPTPHLVADSGNAVVYINPAAEAIPAFDQMTGVVLWALQSELTARPDAAVATIVAYQKALDLIKSDPAKVKQLIRSTFRAVPESVFNAAFEDARTFYSTDTAIRSGGMIKALELYRGKVGEGKLTEAEANAYFTNSYVERAKLAK